MEREPYQERERRPRRICLLCYGSGVDLKNCDHVSRPKCSREHPNPHDCEDKDKAVYLVNSLFNGGFRDFVAELRETEKEYFGLLSHAMTPTPPWYRKFSQVAERYVDLRSLTSDPEADLISDNMKRAKKSNTLLMTFVSEQRILLANSVSGSRIPSFDLSDLRFDSNNDFKVGVHPWADGSRYVGRTVVETDYRFRRGKAYHINGCRNRNCRIIEIGAINGDAATYLFGFPTELFMNLGYQHEPTPFVILTTNDYIVKVRIPNLGHFDSRKVSSSISLSLDSGILTLAMAVFFFATEPDRQLIRDYDLEKWYKYLYDMKTNPHRNSWSVVGRVLARVPISGPEALLRRAAWTD